VRTRRHALLVLSTGHAASDLVQGAVPAMLPFMVHQRGLSYGAAAGLLLAASAASSIVQPLFGAVSDRVHAAWMMPAGAALGGVGVALAGWAGSYSATLLALLVAGLGVAAFHPEAARFAGYAAEGRAAGMSTFSVGGNIGFALGPILAAPLAIVFGLRGMIGIAIVTGLAALLLVRELPALEHLRPPSQSRRGAALGSDRWGAFSLIAGAGALRTGVTFALQAFIPLFVIDRLGGSEAVGAAAVAVLLLAGGAGTLVGGWIADSFGHRRLVVWSLIVCVPLCLVVPAAGIAALFVLMVAIGLAMDANYATIIVLGQSCLPSRVGVASGITIGLSVGFGAACAWLLGVLADHASLVAALHGTTVLAAAAALLAVAVPRDVGRRAPAA
jgi:FSR family fosmidomycin resistance protein-like MFS transporter